MSTVDRKANACLLYTSDGVYLGSDPSNVDYGAIFGGRRQILDRAAERFAADKPADFDDFIQANEDWLIPYCEFMTVKEECGLKAFWEAMIMLSSALYCTFSGGKTTSLPPESPFPK